MVPEVDTTRRSLLAAVAGAVGGAALPTGSARAQSDAADWPMPRRDARKSAVAPVELPSGPPTTRRVLRSKGVNGCVVADGRVHLAGRTLASAALEDVGSEPPRTHPLPDAVYEVNTPAVADGTVYVPADDLLVAVDAATGAVSWQRQFEEPLVGRPTYADGSLYVSSQDALVAVDAATGEPGWRTKLEFTGSPTVANDTVFVQTLTDRSALFAVDAATGAVKWWRQPDLREGDDGYSEISNVPAVGGRVFAAIGSRLFAFTTSGRHLWTVGLGDYLFEGMAATEQTLFVPTAKREYNYSETLWAVNTATGNVRWRYEVDLDEDLGAPTVTEGAVLVTVDNDLVALDRVRGVPRWRIAVDSTWSGWLRPPVSPVLATDRNLFVATENGLVVLGWESDSLRDRAPTVAAGAVLGAGVVGAGMRLARRGGRQ